ncbi:MAG: hypothetical protein DI582_00015 [Azospirillum brasilense]|nr:MAG: hypothetical protein DI582_00015 [Azospirillum brasilense]
MTTKSPQTIIENAIAKADSSYFFEDYTKQARAVQAALEKAGFAIMPREFADEVWKQVADQMRTGRLKPEEHVKDVYQTVLRVAASQGSR